MKPSAQKIEITLSQALVVGREGYVDCPFCPARLHCDETKTVNCADVVRDCFKIVTKELERMQTVPDIDKCPSCVGMREQVERYKNMAQMAIDNLIGE